jgi:DNA-directed RNA polymerase subunit beta
MSHNNLGPARKSYARIPDILPLPPLIEVQHHSYQWFCDEGLRMLFEEISPIVSFNKNLELHFGEFRFGDPQYDMAECRDRDITFAVPLHVKTRLINKDTGEVLEQEVFMGDFPLMTPQGTFIINGAERVVVSQLIRSPGAYFTVEEDRRTGRELCMAKLIPDRGAWLEFDTAKRDIISVKVNRKRKIPVTTLLRAMGYGSDDELLALFADVDNVQDHRYIEATLQRDPTSTRSHADGAAGVEAALLDFYKKQRPGDPATLENATAFLDGLLFTPRRYDLGRVGRYKLNRRLGLNVPMDTLTLTREDTVKLVERMILINNGVERPDDIDHLGNRRVKTVGELVQHRFRIGLLRMERMVRERMSTRDPEQLTPANLINTRPITGALREFFGASQLSQFMDQTNPLTELTHKRTLSALGPGGLRRERAGFDVRDVHHSHYGRICPIETPEGPNIGLIGRLAAYARVNEYGFVETPYRKVVRNVPNRVEDLVGEVVREAVTDPDTGEVLAENGTHIDEALAERLAQLAERLPEVKVWPRATEVIEFLEATTEDRYSIAQASAVLDAYSRFVEQRVPVRRSQDFLIDSPDRVDYMDVSPQQIVGISAALIPFLEHDDANRALMGSNMQRQAVPLIQPEAPLVGTGMEWPAAVESGHVLLAEAGGQVVSATAEVIKVLHDDGHEKTYALRKYERTNQSTCVDQRPCVDKGDRVEQGTVLADSSSTVAGELALGQNVLAAFMSWEGANYEDAIVVSERLVQDDKFTSVHIEKHEVEARDTKLGTEEITRDIPNVGEEALRNLDQDGVVRIGARVSPGDILVGKITPKGETELSPEERLLRAIFGEKAREVKDSSLRLPHGEKGKVIDLKVFSRDEHRDLSAGVEKMARVMVAQKRKIKEGDKMAGRHGNKGVISSVVPVIDMPFLSDGTPVDIVLNPLGVPGRMNIGQILESHLGWAAERLGLRAESPVFDGATEDEIAAELARAWLIDRAWDKAEGRAWKWATEQAIPLELLEDEEHLCLMYLSSWLGERGYDGARVLEDRTYARRAMLFEWLREWPQGYTPERLLVFETDTRAAEERRRADEEVRTVCLREWLKQMTRENLRTTCYQMRAAEDESEAADCLEAPGDDSDRDVLMAEMDRISALSDAEVTEEAVRLAQVQGLPLPTWGKLYVYDGKTGERYDNPVTVGVITMMKLHHLVEDKVHARATGPYSLVTQQPLGGKAQFGGQRFGEMEVWALEAYGAAHALQEMLTIKSDDVTGRVKAYEAIVKGDPIVAPGVPEGFRVLVKELQSLGLSVEVINPEGEIVRFGRAEEEERVPSLGFSLSVPGAMGKDRLDFFGSGFDGDE